MDASARKRPLALRETVAWSIETHLLVPCAHLHVGQLNNRTIFRFFSVSKYFGVFFAGLINSDLADPVGSEAEKRLGKDYAAKVEYVCFLST